MSVAPPTIDPSGQDSVNERNYEAPQYPHSIEDESEEAVTAPTSPLIDRTGSPPQGSHGLQAAHRKIIAGDASQAENKIEGGKESTLGLDLKKWRQENTTFTLKDKFKNEERDLAWSSITGVVESYSTDLVERWNRQIDGLLTFAGLFSAILSAFNVQSYQLLQPSASDQTNALLSQISNQLASFRTSAPFVNSTQPAYDRLQPSPPQFKAPTYAIWVNTLWFVSIVFSLAAATIGILVKQWINEFSTGIHGNSREMARRRQYRLDALQKWRVAKIVALIPLLLLIALVLFLAGLVILLYNLHGTVASITSSFIGVLLLFVTVTTILPTFNESCCFYSAQARLVFRAWDIAVFLFQLLYIIPSWIYISLRKYGYRKSLREAISEFRSTHYHPIWKKAEQAMYNKESEKLSPSAMTTSYTATFDLNYIDRSILTLTRIDDPKLWQSYLSKTVTILNSSGRYKSWSDALKEKVSSLLFSASGFCWNISSNRPDDPAPSKMHDKNITPLCTTLIETVAGYEDSLVLSPDTLTSVFATSASLRQYRPQLADDIWKKHFIGKNSEEWKERFSDDDHIKIENLSTYCLVAAAAADRLYGLVAHGTAVRPLSTVNGFPEWDLKFVWQHIYVIRKLLEHPKLKDDSGLQWFQAISPVIEHAFASIRIILKKIGRQSSHRSTFWESEQYIRLLKNVRAIFDDDRGTTWITEDLVVSLSRTFSGLKEDWVNKPAGGTASDIQYCTEILNHLQDKFPQVSIRLATEN